MAKINALSVALIGGLLVYYLGRKTTDSTSTPILGSGFWSGLGKNGTNGTNGTTGNGITGVGGDWTGEAGKGGDWSLTDEEREKQYLEPPGNQTANTVIKQPDTTATIVLGPTEEEANIKSAKTAADKRAANRARANVSADVLISGKDPEKDTQAYYDEWSYTDAPAFDQTRLRQVSKRPGEAIGVAYTWTAGTTSWNGTAIPWQYKHDIVMSFKDIDGIPREVARKSRTFNGVSGPQSTESYSFTTPGEATGTRLEISVYVYGKESTDAGAPGTKYTLLTQASKADAVGIIGSYGIPGSSLGTIEIQQTKPRWRYGPTAYQPRV